MSLPRVPEPQLMAEMEQARAYALADFEEPHSRFIELIRECYPGEEFEGFGEIRIGLGRPADIPRRFAEAFPKMRMHAIDGSEAMLHFARITIDSLRLHEQIRLFKRLLPDDTLPKEQYTAVISNSLLHHLAEPMVLWESIKRYAAPGAPVFVMDLVRPATLEEVDNLVWRYARNEPQILQEDFRHSLLAAYTPEEVRQQLSRAGLDGLSLKEVSDRHMIIFGNM